MEYFCFPELREEAMEMKYEKAKAEAICFDGTEVFMVSSKNYPLVEIYLKGRCGLFTDPSTFSFYGSTFTCSAYDAFSPETIIFPDGEYCTYALSEGVWTCTHY